MKNKDKKLLIASTEDGISIAVDKAAVAEELENWRAAEALVIAYEKRRGWQAEKVNENDKVSKCGYDIKSIKDGQERHIEVKSKLGKEKKFGWLQLTANETAQFWRDPYYCVYLVEGDCNDSTAIVNIVEIDKVKLNEMAIEKKVVRFSRLGSLKRTPFKK